MVSIWYEAVRVGQDVRWRKIYRLGRHGRVVWRTKKIITIGQ